MTQITEPPPSRDSSFLRLQFPLLLTLMFGAKILPLLFGRMHLSLLPSALLTGLAIAIVAFAITLTTKRPLPLGKWTGPFIGATGSAMALAFSFIDAWEQGR